MTRFGPARDKLLPSQTIATSTASGLCFSLLKWPKFSAIFGAYAASPIDRPIVPHFSLAVMAWSCRSTSSSRRAILPIGKLPPVHFQKVARGRECVADAWEIGGGGRNRE